MELVKLNIDGKEVEVPAGTTVLQAADEAGAHIPRLCYDPELSLAGACRLCMVEIEGWRGMAASCITEVSPGMVVKTETPDVAEVRKTILELLLANNPELANNAKGNNVLAKYCEEYEVKDSPFKGETNYYEIDDSNPFIVRDFSLCILCGKCVRACTEMTGQDNLGFLNRGYDRKATTAGDVDYINSDCVFCGQCVAVCPTGALTEKSLTDFARDELKTVRTTCPFCGTGCNFDLAVKDDKIVGVLSNPESPVNGRSLCVKGRFGWDFVHNEKRLKTPLIKKHGQFVTASWDEALDLIAERFKEIKDEYGSESFAALSSARCTNEENYLVQKFTRAVMGTNNVDHCART